MPEGTSSKLRAVWGKSPTLSIILRDEKAAPDYDPFGEHDMDPQHKPVLEILHEGGYRIRLNASSPFSGSGPTVKAAIEDLGAVIARTYDAEKGDESLQAQTAARQTDILANDPFIRGGQLQHTVLLAAAFGLM